MSVCRYEAWWVPGLTSDFDPDTALTTGLNWLGSVAVDGERLIAVNAMDVQSDPLLSWAASYYRIVTPRTRNNHAGPKPRAVLAVWPAAPALELAETLALRGALCVIPGTIFDIVPWCRRTDAINLLDPDVEADELSEIDPEVASALDRTLFFGGHNRFLGGGEKVDAIRTLRSIAGHSDRPDPPDRESYVLASGKTNHEGARRLREWYEGVLAGRQYRDYAHRPI